MCSCGGHFKLHSLALVLHSLIEVWVGLITFDSSNIGRVLSIDTAIPIKKVVTTRLVRKRFNVGLASNFPF